VKKNIILLVLFFIILWVAYLIALCKTSLREEAKECYAPESNPIETKNEQVTPSTNDGPYLIEMYSGGILVKRWVTNPGSVKEYRDNVFYFVDAATGRNTVVKGDVVITDFAGSEDIEIFR
jgi:hypothetical protein